MRAEEYRVQPPADVRERLVHLFVDRVQRAHVEEAAADPRLVGGDDDAVARVVEPGDRLEAPGIGRHSSGDLMYWSLS